jgi:hypothetical protein
MNKKNKVKEFDCLDFKYKVQEEIFNKIKDMSFEEEKAYFNKQAFIGSFKKFIDHSEYQKK